MSQTLQIGGGSSTVNSSYVEYHKPEVDALRRQSYRVILETGQDGWIIATCVNLKGAHSQGKDRNDALRNVAEAISAILEDATGNPDEEFSIVYEEEYGEAPSSIGS